MAVVRGEELSEALVRRLAADLPRHLQNRLGWSFDHYLRRRRQTSRAESLLHLHALTFTDGVRTYEVRRTATGWVLEEGGIARGRRALDPRGEMRLPLVHRAIYRGLSDVRRRLRKQPIAKTKSLASARRHLRELLVTQPAVLRDLTVVTVDRELVLAMHRGLVRRGLSEPTVTWRAFCEGAFAPGAVAVEIAAHVFQVSPSTVQKALADSRRKS